MQSLSDLLKEARELFGNPVVAIDTSYNLLARSENSVADDSLWNELAENGRFCQKTVDFFNGARFIQAVADTDTVALLQDPSLKYDRACAKFFDANGIQLGSIVVVACSKGFEPRDFEAMREVCGRITELVRTSMTERAWSDAEINALLEGGADNPIVGELYGRLKSYLYVAVADISEYDPTLSHLAYFRDVFASIQSEFKYFIYLNNIVAILSFDHAVLNFSEELAPLRKFFMEHRIRAGISSVFQNLLEVQTYYKQALSAFNHGMGRSGKWIFEYDACLADSFLSAAEDVMDLSVWRSPLLELITDYDKLHGTRYLKAARDFLLDGTRRTKPLNEMRKIFDVDWGNRDLTISLSLALKMMEG